MRIRRLLLSVAVVGTSVSLGFAQDASSFKTLYSFTGQPDGANPSAYAGLIGSGVLYGTTQYGGTGPCTLNSSTGCGTVFSLTPPTSPGGSWTEAVLYSFLGGSDGNSPEGGVAIGSGGVLYGTTEGGTSPNGTAFRLKPPTSPGGSWTEKVLDQIGGNPVAGLVIGSGGVLYGTTLDGGTSLAGTVFSITPPTSPGGSWTETLLHTFDASPGDGYSPYSDVVIGSGGVLYGTTSGGPSLPRNNLARCSH
jgi:hypothetical protein